MFFENHTCVACQRTLAYDPLSHEMHSYGDGEAPALCRNRASVISCNWVASPGHEHCLSCRTSRLIPSQEKPENRLRWRKLESAKRRLIFNLMSLNLPVDPNCLSFEFKEDQRTNPFVSEAYVTTGHSAGVITINAAEADDVFREQMRVQMNEPYRTLLGHMRHESGHYYFPLLVTGALLDEARELFGDERVNYQAALDRYYNAGPVDIDFGRYVSSYAGAHPAEDWAECWAHYLHLSAVLETAEAEELTSAPNEDGWYAHVTELLVNINELTRSLGLPDAYPFVYGETVIEKIEFVRRVVRSALQG